MEIDFFLERHKLSLVLQGSSRRGATIRCYEGFFWRGTSTKASYKEGSVSVWFRFLGEAHKFRWELQGVEPVQLRFLERHIIRLFATRRVGFVLILLSWRGIKFRVLQGLVFSISLLGTRLVLLRGILDFWFSRSEGKKKIFQKALSLPLHSSRRKWPWWIVEILCPLGGAGLRFSKGTSADALLSEVGAVNLF